MKEQREAASDTVKQTRWRSVLRTLKNIFGRLELSEGIHWLVSVCICFKKKKKDSTHVCTTHPIHEASHNYVPIQQTYTHINATTTTTTTRYCPQLKIVLQPVAANTHKHTHTGAHANTNTHATETDRRTTILSASLDNCVSLLYRGEA